MFTRLYGVLLPFFVSFLLAYVLDPVVAFVQNKCRVRNRALAVVVTLLMVVCLVVGAVAALRKPVMDQVNAAWAGFQSYIADFNIDDYVSAETQEKLLQWQEEWDWQKPSLMILMSRHSSRFLQNLNLLLTLIIDA